ncbi:MAG: hypothetical protein LBB90_02585, partial [Tannerella sp.]|nr:hypothetical protein [Tannerella sp.]
SVIKYLLRMRLSKTQAYIQSILFSRHEGLFDPVIGQAVCFIGGLLCNNIAKTLYNLSFG